MILSNKKKWNVNNQNNTDIKIITQKERNSNIKDYDSIYMKSY